MGGSVDELGATMDQRQPVIAVVVDDSLSQGRTAVDRLRSVGVGAAHVAVNLRDVWKKGQIPADRIDKIMRDLAVYGDLQLVVVDVCLAENPLGDGAEGSDTWTGPALMAAIRERMPKVRLASYSAYTDYIPSDIDEQKRNCKVADTPHWSKEDLSTEKVLKYLRGES